MVVNNINETKLIAYKVAGLAKNGDIYALIGDLASGKTSFTKFFIDYFIKDVSVISPTFTIVKSYKVDKGNIKYINHFDVYRIKNTSELLDIGFYDYLYDKNSINIIEWADLIIDELPKETVFINFKKIFDDDNKREIIINGKDIGDRNIK